MKSKSKGFTLIELLVVIAIIGVLSSIVLASLKSAKDKANDAARAANVKALKTALEMYYSDNHMYPQYGAPDTAQHINKLELSLVPTYIRSFPSILTADLDEYTYASDPNSYGLYIYTEAARRWCRTGVNVNPAWWTYWYIPAECNF